MTNIESNNKTIAKNTLMLYMRMLLMTIVGLYTSRVVLAELGASDFGIFNVVGGFVSMLAYLNTVFIDASQRFISVSLGKNDVDAVKRTFSTALSIHFIIAAIVLVGAETFGLWFINTKLNIDPERMYAANWVYQCSILSLLFTIVNIPYKSMIVAKEHMHIYAYASVVEAVMKLVIVFMLQLVAYDKLIVYSILYLCVSIVLPAWYFIYSHRKFVECKFSLSRDNAIFKEMMSYSMWVVVGNLGFTFKDQFSNILINVFCGTIVNAARGIAGQVNGLVTSFANNFLMALSPQITKQYSAGNTDRSFSLVCNGAKYAFYLMAIMAIPIIVNIDFLLGIWLKDVPDYTSSFVVITLIASIFYASSKTLTVAIQAGGDIKYFQIGISIIMLLELPIAYVLLKIGMEPYFALMPAIFTNILGILFRLFIANKIIAFNYIKSYISEIFLKGVPIIVIGIIVSYFVGSLIPNDIVRFFITSVFSVSLTCALIYFLGLSKAEKEVVMSYVNSAINRMKK